MARGIALSAEQRRNLVAATICTSAVGTTMGLMWPLLALILDHRGVGSELIGFNSASQALATLIGPPLALPAMRRLGMAKCAAGCILAISIALLLLKIFDNVQAWFVIRFALGAGSTILFSCTQTWVNQIAPDHIRGRVIGVFGLLWSAGFGAGPLIIRFTGIEGWPPFLAAILLVVVAGLPLLLAAEAPAEASDKLALAQVLPMLRLGVVVMAASVVQGVLDATIDSFLPIFGLRNGLTQGSAVFLLIVLQAGILVAQYPVGWAADRVNRGRLLKAMTGLGLATCLLLPLSAQLVPLLWLDLFLLGLAVGGIWTVSLIIAGQLFSGAGLAAALALKGVLYGIGSISGPSSTGIAFASYGPNALPAVLAGVCGLFLLLQLGYRSRPQGAA
jgi:MFS family permease